MAVQQCKMSKQRMRTRKAANRYKGLEANSCPNCGGARMPHRVCSHCGFYKDRQVLSVTAE